MKLIESHSLKPGDLLDGWQDDYCHRFRLLGIMLVVSTDTLSDNIVMIRVIDDGSIKEWRLYSTVRFRVVARSEGGL